MLRHAGEYIYLSPVSTVSCRHHRLLSLYNFLETFFLPHTRLNMAVLSVLVSLLLTSGALAAPTLEKKSFRVSAEFTTKRALYKRHTGRAATEFDGGGWIIPVVIGGQTVTLNLDTGSSDM